VKGYGLGGGGAIFSSSTRLFFHSVQASSKVHPVSTQWITRVVGRYSGKGVKLATYLNLVARSRIMELYLHSPKRLHAVKLNQIF
jgi:hypothetical protein